MLRLILCENSLVFLSFFIFDGHRCGSNLGVIFYKQLVFFLFFQNTEFINIVTQFIFDVLHGLLLYSLVFNLLFKFLNFISIIIFLLFEFGQFLSLYFVNKFLFLHFHHCNVLFHLHEGWFFGLIKFIGS